MGLLDGVTTNPSLMKKAGGADFHEHIVRICEIVDGDVSAEVTATDFDGIMAEARTLAALHPQVVVKVPLIPEGIRAIRSLSGEEIRTNCTLCFSPTQALIAAKAGATYISPFVGRLDDISTSGMELIGQIVQIYENYGYETQVLAASIRHPLHVVEAALAGADVATIPYAVLMQLMKHPLTDLGLERFLADWEQYRQAAATSNGAS
jgi:transaldolase